MLATISGFSEMLEFILKDPLIDINKEDPQTGCNSFWMAAYYNRGECLAILAKAGINIMSTHKITKSNALHIAF